MDTTVSTTIREVLTSLPQPFNLLVVWVALVDLLVLSVFFVCFKPDNSPQSKKRFIIQLVILSSLSTVLMLAACIWQFYLE